MHGCGDDGPPETQHSARRPAVSVPSSLQGQLEAHQEEGMVVSHMAIAGVGIWVAFTSGSTLRLFHTETLKHLQDVNIATPVHHMLPGGAFPRAGARARQGALRARAEGHRLFLVVSRPRGGGQDLRWKNGGRGDWLEGGGVTGWPPWAPPAPGGWVFPQQDSEQPACRVGAWGLHVCACACV